MVEGTIKQNSGKKANRNESGFFNIYFHKVNQHWVFAKTISNRKYVKAGFNTARAAAIALDKWLIADGHEPINVFKRV